MGSLILFLLLIQSLNPLAVNAKHSIKRATTPKLHKLKNAPYSAYNKQLAVKSKIVSSVEKRSQTCSQTGNHQEAGQHSKRYEKLKDSLFTKKSNDSANTFDVTNGSVSKEKTIQALVTQIHTQQWQIDQQRGYLFGLIGLFSASILAGYVFFRQTILKASQQKAELQQQLLRTQMNPHFIFNALMAIQHFMYTNSLHEAGKYLSGFAKLIRLILENSCEQYVSLDKEIGTLHHYFELQRLRFKNKFDYSIYISPDIDPEIIAVPPMLAQPLIENSLEHGILHKEEKGFIQVRFLSKGKTMLLEVEDNGIGRPEATQMKSTSPNKHRSMATTIIRERLSLFNRKKKEKIKLSVTDLLDTYNTVQGTKIAFSIPFRLL